MNIQWIRRGLGVNDMNDASTIHFNGPLLLPVYTIQSPLVVTLRDFASGGSADVIGCGITKLDQDTNYYDMSYYVYARGTNFTGGIANVLILGWSAY